MRATVWRIGGETMLLDPAGLLVWPSERLVAVADLHLEKGSAGARAGSLLPPWDTGVTLERLLRVCDDYEAATLVAVGDSFHDGDGSARLSGADRRRLAALAAGRRVVWVAGNHDPEPMAGVPGEAACLFRAGPLLFRHQAYAGARPAAEIEVCGHHHPKARVATRGGGVCRPCFVACASGTRLMLPAFGAYAGGLDVTDPAIAALFPRGGRCFLTGSERLFGFDLGRVPG